MSTPASIDERLIRRLLAFETGESVTPEGRAEAAERVFAKTFGVLAPIIGADGVDAIFQRSVRLTKPTFPCLAIVAAQAAKLDARYTLRACEREGDGVHFVDVAVALYTRFFSLIAALVGERLASRIILTAWPGIADTRMTEEEEEE